MMRLPARVRGGLVIVVCCLVAAVCGTAVIDRLLQRPRRNGNSKGPIPHTYLWGQAYTEAAQESRSNQERKLPVGTLAPDLALRDATDGHKVRLSELRGRRPAVLMFGSFGCDVFCRHLPRLNALFETYKDAAEFLFVYTSEGPHYVLPRTSGSETKEQHIRRGLQYFGLTLPCFLAEEQDVVQSAYRANPERLLLVDRQGGIALDAGRGLRNGWDFDAITAWLKDSSVSAKGKAPGAPVR